MKNTVFSDPAYQAVMFECDFGNGMIQCLGFTYSSHIEEFKKADHPMKRFYLCNVVIDTQNNTVVKNQYQGMVL